MRFLKTSEPEPYTCESVLVFREFHPVDAIRYAVLSHIRDEDEALFEDVQDLHSWKKPESALKLIKPKSFEKLTRALELARGNGDKLLFVETCCIDKRSSVEVSEAIDSLHSWYSNADVCYTYLSDVQSGLSKNEFEDQFTKSHWFAKKIDSAGTTLVKRALLLLGYVGVPWYERGLLRAHLSSHGR